MGIGHRLDLRVFSNLSDPVIDICSSSRECHSIISVLHIGPKQPWKKITSFLFTFQEQLMILVAVKATGILCGIIPRPNENKPCSRCTLSVSVHTLATVTLPVLQGNLSAHLSSQQLLNSPEWLLSPSRATSKLQGHPAFPSNSPALFLSACTQAPLCYCLKQLLLKRC